MVYVITNLKIKGMTSLVSVALLTGLDGQYVGMNLSHLLFYLYHNVGTKNNPFTRFGPTQGCASGSAIECLKR
jgi:hypothetical protein